jgi:hypothetical protein
MLNIKGIELVKTCSACPEQYDAFLNGVQVGYFRLRHGHFRVDCPNNRGETVFEANPKGDGSFYDDEREHFLTLGIDALKEYLKTKNNKITK